MEAGSFRFFSHAVLFVLELMKGVEESKVKLYRIGDLRTAWVMLMKQSRWCHVLFLQLLLKPFHQSAHVAHLMASSTQEGVEGRKAHEFQRPFTDKRFLLQLGASKDLSLIFKAFAADKQIDKVCALVEALRNESLLDCHHCTGAISACAKATAWHRAIDLFESMCKTSLRSDLVCMNVIITSWEKGSRWQRALEFAFKGTHRPDNFSLSTVLNSCKKGNQWQEALYEFNRSPRPNVISFSAAISACERAGEWEQALQLFQRMQDMSLRRDAISFSAMISALGSEKAGQWQWALQLFQTMFDARAARPVRLIFTETRCLLKPKRGSGSSQASVKGNLVGSSGLEVHLRCLSCFLEKRRQVSQGLTTSLRGVPRGPLNFKDMNCPMNIHEYEPSRLDVDVEQRKTAARSW